MVDNRELLAELVRTRQLDIQRGSIFEVDPAPMPPGFDFDRIEGMMLGLAVGDALGSSTKGMCPRERYGRYGEIRDYRSAQHSGEARGLPSAATQLAFWTLDQMLLDGAFDPAHVAARFCDGRIFGAGSTVKTFIRRHKAGLPWHQCGPRSAGNGALMRIAPMILPHLTAGTADVWVDTVLSAIITHRDAASTAACLSFINMLWQLLRMQIPPTPLWWLETYVAVARELEVGGCYRPRGGAYTDYEGPMWRFVDTCVRGAFGQGLSVREACDAWGSGAYLLETMASVLYILMCYGDTPEEALVRAVNDTKDNDTIAAVVGAAVGALHGKEAIPAHWLENLSGRTAGCDDGKVWALLDQAQTVWWTTAVASRQ